MLRGPVAKRKKARIGNGNEGKVDISRRVDTGIQGPLRRQTIDHFDRKIRGNVVKWTPRRLRLGNICRQWWVNFTFLNLTSKNKLVFTKIFLQISRVIFITSSWHDFRNIYIEYLWRKYFMYVRFRKIRGNINFWKSLIHSNLNEILLDIFFKIHK